MADSLLPPPGKRPALMRIGLLCALHVTALAGLLLVTPGRDDFWMGACIGLIMGQVSLTALWLTLGGGALFVRLPGSLAAIAVLAWSAGFMERREHFVDFWLWFGLFATAGLITGAPFLVFRARGCQLARPAAGEAGLRPEALQFSIKDLGLWTLAAALALGGFRWLTSLTPFQELPAQRELWLIFILGSMFAAVGVVTAWAALGTRLAPLRIAACCMVTALAGPTIGVLIGRPADIFITATVISGVVVLGSLLVLRSAGYRLLGRGAQMNCTIVGGADAAP